MFLKFADPALATSATALSACLNVSLRIRNTESMGSECVCPETAQGFHCYLTDSDLLLP